MPRPPSGKAPKGRRPNGDGSFRVRKDGRIEATIRLEGKRHSVYGRNKTEAKAKLDELRKKHSKGVNLSSKNQTVGAFLEEYLREVAAPNLRAVVYRDYHRITYQYLVPNLGALPLSKLTTRDVQKLINDVDKSPSTIRYVRAVLRRALNVALSWQLIEYNPATNVILPKTEKFKVTPFTPEQSALFIQTIKGHRLEGLYLLALFTGMRQGELLGLRKQDVDLSKREISIEGQIQLINKKLEWVTTKTEESRRTVPLPSIAVESILRIYHEHPYTELLFVTKNGTAIRARNLVRQFKTLLKQAGLPDTLRFHDTRHSAATNLLPVTDIRTVMELLGHTQASTTLNIYSHSNINRKRQAVEEIANGSTNGRTLI